MQRPTCPPSRCCWRTPNLNPQQTSRSKNSYNPWNSDHIHRPWDFCINYCCPVKPSIYYHDSDRNSLTKQPWMVKNGTNTGPRCLLFTRRKLDGWNHLGGIAHPPQKGRYIRKVETFLQGSFQLRHVPWAECLLETKSEHVASSGAGCGIFIGHSIWQSLKYVGPKKSVMRFFL